MAMSAVTLLSVHCVFMCFRETMRKSPQNYVLLALFTLAKGVFWLVVSHIFLLEHGGITQFIDFLQRPMMIKHQIWALGTPDFKTNTQLYLYHSISIYIYSIYLRNEMIIPLDYDSRIWMVISHLTSIKNLSAQGKSPLLVACLSPSFVGQ